MNSTLNLSVKTKLARGAGFTLIEMSVALAVMSIMLLASVPVVRAEQQRSKEKELRVALLQIRQALDEYKRAADDGRIAKEAGTSGYPLSLASLATPQPVINNTKPSTITFLRKVPADPFAPLEARLGDSASTWGLRSYASPPDKPTAGSDVFDVYSRSEVKGNNGVEYSKW